MRFYRDYLERVKVRRKWTRGRILALKRAYEQLEIEERRHSVEMRARHQIVTRECFRLLSRKQKLNNRSFYIFLWNGRKGLIRGPFYYLTGLTLPMITTSGF